MIQRIQTLFLLVASAFTAFIFFVPISQYFVGGGNTIQFYCAGLKGAAGADVINNIAPPIVILSITLGLSSLATIFIYKNRPLQMRFCVLTILLNIGNLTLMVYYSYKISNVLKSLFPDNTIGHRFSYAIVFPVVGIILLWLSYRAINKDEMLVRSADRLR